MVLKKSTFVKLLAVFLCAILMLTACAAPANDEGDQGNQADPGVNATAEPSSDGEFEDGVYEGSAPSSRTE